MSEAVASRIASAMSREAAAYARSADGARPMRGAANSKIVKIYEISEEIQRMAVFPLYFFVKFC